MPDKKLKEYLDNHQVEYASVSHSPAFTSQEIAAAAHVSGKHLAKVVVVKVQDKLALVVLPANNKINFAKLKKLTGNTQVDLASESEFKDKFPGCEVGAMSAFGNLYDMPVYLSSHLTHQDRLLFNAGSHSELIEVALTDFERLVHPHEVPV